MKHKHHFKDEAGYISEKKNMACFVQIPQQSYLKFFQNIMFILFCTGINMVMNNLRVKRVKVISG